MQTPTMPAKPSKGMPTWAIVAIVLGSIAIVGLVCLALLAALLLPALSAARQSARRMQNSTHLRGLHQSMFNYANNNQQYLPGIDIPGAPQDTSVENRFFLLLDGQYISADYLISPGESYNKTQWQGGPVTSSHYSYNLLQVATPGLRQAAWRSQLNSMAVLASDRNVGPDANANIQSIWTSNPGNWSGSVLWADNHVTFENQADVQTNYGNHTTTLPNQQPMTGMPALDNLFTADNNDDAHLIHSGS